MINFLPVYKGYTVDYRLKQFRKCPKSPLSRKMIEFVDFDSDKGDLLLCEMIKKNLVPGEVLSRLF